VLGLYIGSTLFGLASYYIAQTLKYKETRPQDLWRQRHARQQVRRYEPRSHLLPYMRRLTYGHLFQNVYDSCRCLQAQTLDSAQKMRDSRLTPRMLVGECRQTSSTHRTTFPVLSQGRLHSPLRLKSTKQIRRLNSTRTPAQSRMCLAGTHRTPYCSPTHTYRRNSNPKMPGHCQCPIQRTCGLPFELY
jgi:hypothetical protein